MSLSKDDPFHQYQELLSSTYLNDIYY